MQKALLLDSVGRVTVRYCEKKIKKFFCFLELDDVTNLVLLLMFLRLLIVLWASPVSGRTSAVLFRRLRFWIIDCSLWFET